MAIASPPPPRLRSGLARGLATLTAAYTAILVLATHYPRPEVFLGAHPPSDKALHFMAYGLLGLLSGGTLALARQWSATRALGLAAVLAIFAALDELTQPLFKRDAEPLDWVCDCLGVACGLAAVAAAVLVVRFVRGRYAQLGVGGR